MRPESKHVSAFKQQISMLWSQSDIQLVNRVLERAVTDCAFHKKSILALQMRRRIELALRGVKHRPKNPAVVEKLCALGSAQLGAHGPRYHQGIQRELIAVSYNSVQIGFLRDFSLVGTHEAAAQ